MSSSHVAMFDAIGQAKRISGVSGIDYISNPYVREHRLCGEVRDVGYDTNLNFELLAAMRPDLMLLYGVTGENTIVTGKLRELGIPYYISATTWKNPRWARPNGWSSRPSFATCARPGPTRCNGSPGTTRP